MNSAAVLQVAMHAEVIVGEEEEKERKRNVGSSFRTAAIYIDWDSNSGSHTHIRLCESNGGAPGRRTEVHLPPARYVSWAAGAAVLRPLIALVARPVLGFALSSRATRCHSLGENKATCPGVTSTDVVVRFG